MQLIGTLETATHVIASSETCYVFSDIDSDAVNTDVLEHFGTDITEEGIACLTYKRHDLFFATINKRIGAAVMSSDGSGLDPHTSAILYKALNLLRLDLVQVWKNNVHFYKWRTKLEAVSSGEPSVWYHGTSSSKQQSICDAGITIDNERQWNESPRGFSYFSATPQVAAFHAHRSAAKNDALPIVVAVEPQAEYECDYDVRREIVECRDVPDGNALIFTREAGLFAYGKNIPATAIAGVFRPNPDRPFDEWERLR